MLSNALNARRLIRLLAAAGIATGSLALTSGSALADCTQASPWPSFTESAGSAEQIVITTVTWTLGGAVNNLFTVHVDEVVRGTSPETITFAAFRSGAPQPICPEDSVLRVRDVGDRLAFAYGAHLPGLDDPITAVAFVAPSQPDLFLMPKMETLTVDQIRAIGSGLPPTDVEFASRRSSDGAAGWTLALCLTLTLGLTAAVAFDRRAGTAR